MSTPLGQVNEKARAMEHSENATLKAAYNRTQASCPLTRDLNVMVREHKYDTVQQWDAERMVWITSRMEETLYGVYIPGYPSWYATKVRPFASN